MTNEERESYIRCLVEAAKDDTKQELALTPKPLVVQDFIWMLFSAVRDLFEAEFSLYDDRMEMLFSTGERVVLSAKLL